MFKYTIYGVDTRNAHAAPALKGSIQADGTLGPKARTFGTAAEAAAHAATLGAVVLTQPPASNVVADRALTVWVCMVPAFG